MENSAREVASAAARLIHAVLAFRAMEKDDKSIEDALSEPRKNELPAVSDASSHTDSGKITTAEKSHVEIRQADASGKARTIKVEVKKKRVFVRRDDSEQKEAPLSPPTKVTNISVDQISPQIESRSKKIRWRKLKAVEISNFKAIQNLHLPLSDVTVLVGPNGSGKSSVLQAIHWATRAASYIPPKEQSEVVSFERLDYSPSSEPLTTAHRGILSTERSSQPTSVVFNHVETEADQASTATIKIWAARNRGGISVHIEGGSAVTPFKQREELISTYIPGLAGLSEKETILVKPLLRRQAAGGDAGGVLRNVLFNIASRQTAEADNKAAMERMEHLNRLIQIVHPNVRIEVSFDEREDVHIQASFDDDLLSGEKRPLEAAATGVLQVIQIFAYLVLFQPKLLLIDEPDAHLHPDKQERLIEALELAANEFEVQVLLTTHSPHIARAASPAVGLLWVNNGQVVEEQNGKIRSLLGWGGLDKKILFFVEDENDLAIRSILRQWPQLHRQINVCRCFGVDNLPKNALLKGLLGEEAFNVKVLVHRDRDFMTVKEVETWRQKYNADRVVTWVTQDSDAEAYFCEPSYLSALYGIPEEDSLAWIEEAVHLCGDGERTFKEKRRLINRMLNEDGGAPHTDDLWNAEGRISPKNILGKSLHKALKNIAKKHLHDDRKLDRFLIPQGYEVATELRLAIEKLLAV